MSSGEFASVKMEDDDDDEPVIIESSSVGVCQTGHPTQNMLPVERASQSTDGGHYMAQISYGEENMQSMTGSEMTHMKHHTNMQTDVHTTEEMEYGFLPKRRRVTSMLGNSSMRLQTQEYEDRAPVMYDYDAEYDAASVVSEGSYMGDHQRILTEVLNYCQAMYETVQKLDKKFDVLQRKVSEMHHARMKPHFKPRPLGIPHRNSLQLPPGRMRFQKLHQRNPELQISSTPQRTHNPLLRMSGENNIRPQPSSTMKSVPSIPPVREPQPNLQRQSPPLPTIISTHSLHRPFSMAKSRMVDQSLQQTVIEALPESTCAVSSPSTSVCLASPSGRTTSEASYKEMEPTVITCESSPQSIVISDEQPSSSVPTNPEYEFLGNPNRNINISGNFLIKARQKTKPKYAARYLVRVLFSKETLLCSSMGVNARGLKLLDVNKVSAIREFLASAFPAFDLAEYGKDWKTCITNVNAMIRCLRSETKNTAKGKQVTRQEESICVDSNEEEEEGEVLPVEALETSPQTASSTAANQVTTQKDTKEPEPPGSESPAKQQPSDPMEPFGESCRNVQLPFSIIYIGKGKSRPELSARYLIRHLFTEDVLVKSNVYGNLERGILPLDTNKISALRDFLQKHYPSFDLRESGFDWKACVAAINSAIRSLRHDQKKSTMQSRKATPNKNHGHNSSESL
ncbi:BEN domain-containing protein 2 [Discoglossus pictus]